MKFSKTLATAGFMVSLAICSCTKNESFTAVGGNLPTNYITILANGKLQPAVLNIASGSSVTFVNNHHKPHRFLSLDADSSIYTSIIAPDSFFVYKNAGLAGNYLFKCTLDSSIAGIINIRP